MSIINDILWLRIDNILRERGWTIADLRRAAGADERHQNTWYNWRRKKTVMKIDDLERIAIALGTTPANLLTPLEDEKVEPQLHLPF
jgi:transcriptional regulator with XRE-family HTH domain